MNRRNVLKAAGATSTLPFVSGVAAGDEEDDDDENGNGEGQGQGERECPRPNCIHPTLGYTGLAPDEEVPSPLQPDHEVDLITQPPTDGSDRQFPEFYFEPTGLNVSQGDVVRFNLATPDHTVTAYHPGLGRQQRVPDGVPAFSSPVLPGGTFWLYRFDESGVYDVLCAPHEIFGMVGRIVVGDAAADWMVDGDDDGMDDNGGENEAETVERDDGGDDEADDAGETGQGGPPLRPPELTAALVYQDAALNPDNIIDAGQVSWDDLAEESKQILVQLPEGGEE